ncbi:MAG: hypothetical protein NTZ24_12580 [Deltaproteobacteria bacterium]|nr:hypothetical protein [Deltaproteobacteria bacterium]
MVIAVFIVASISFSFALEPKACVKNNAGVVLRVSQSGSPDTPFALGQSMRVYGSRLTLYCFDLFVLGQWRRCQGLTGGKNTISAIDKRLK